MINLDSKKLKNINKPARYVGGEVNQITKSNYDYSIVLCYPNLYEKAMSNYVVNLLYSNINATKNIYCTRCFAPDLDFENFLNENSYNLYSLEDFRDIRENNLLLFVIDNELDFTNFFNMLNLAGISIDKQGRKESDPKIVLLALDNINIKPIARFADYVFNYSDEKESVKRLLKFIEHYFDLNYDKSLFADLSNATKDYENINILHAENGIVPSIKIDNSAIIIDLAYMDNIDFIIRYIENNIKSRGINKVAFRNYDKFDSYKFCELVYRIKMNIEDVRIISKNIDFNKIPINLLNVILPCMEKSAINFKVGTCSSNLIKKIGIGTEREEIIEKIKGVFKNNRNSIKLEFTIGLPEETYADIDNIFEVAEQIVNIYSEFKAKDKLSIIIKLDCYIPNNNDEGIYNLSSINKLDTKIRYINEKKYDYVLKVNMESSSSCITKTLVKTGNERISDVILYAYRLGARFDSDDRKYNKSVWEKTIFDKINIVNSNSKFSSN